jgi:hypothetical protein
MRHFSQQPKFGQQPLLKGAALIGRRIVGFPGGSRVALTVSLELCTLYHLAPPAGQLNCICQRTAELNYRYIQLQAQPLRYIPSTLKSTAQLIQPDAHFPRPSRRFDAASRKSGRFGTAAHEVSKPYFEEANVGNDLPAESHLELMSRFGSYDGCHGVRS